MVKVHVTIVGDKETLSKLKRLRGALSDWTDVLNDVGEYLKKFYREDVFESLGSVYGQAWADLKPEYRAKKSEQFSGADILERTGKMRKSWASRANSDTLDVWNEMFYSDFHQTGTSRMPKRQLVDLPQRQKTYIMNMFKNEVVKLLNKASAK